MNPDFSLADSQHLEDSQPMRNQDLFAPQYLIYLSTVLESVDQMKPGLDKIIFFILGGT